MTEDRALVDASIEAYAPEDWPLTTTSIDLTDRKKLRNEKQN